MVIQRPGEPTAAPEDDLTLPAEEEDLTLPAGEDLALVAPVSQQFGQRDGCRLVLQFAVASGGCARRYRREC